MKGAQFLFISSQNPCAFPPRKGLLPGREQHPFSRRAEQKVKHTRPCGQGRAPKAGKALPWDPPECRQKCGHTLKKHCFCRYSFSLIFSKSHGMSFAKTNEKKKRTGAAHEKCANSDPFFRGITMREEQAAWCCHSTARPQREL